MSKMKKIESGIYHYTDSNEVVWRVINLGYTIGYNCVMWYGSRLNTNLPAHRNEIWGYSRKDVIRKIDYIKN